MTTRQKMLLAQMRSAALCYRVLGGYYWLKEAIKFRTMARGSR